MSIIVAEIQLFLAKTAKNDLSEDITEVNDLQFQNFQKIRIDPIKVHLVSNFELSRWSGGWATWWLRQVLQSPSLLYIMRSRSINIIKAMIPTRWFWRNCRFHAVCFEWLRRDVFSYIEYYIMIIFLSWFCV